MKEHPILFSTEMVRAILSGRKTMTRRILKPQPWYGSHIPGGPHFIWPPGSGQRFNAKTSENGNWYVMQEDFQPRFSKLCPYGKVGDELWVKETWGIDAWLNGNPVYCYKADNVNHRPESFVEDEFGAMKQSGWKPSIHMPRAACRIFLEITDIRVERLQDISEEDAIAEGVDTRCYYEGGHIYELPSRGTVNLYNASLRTGFHALWNKINGEESWNSNPWVWVISFRRIESGLAITKQND